MTGTLAAASAAVLAFPLDGTEPATVFALRRAYELGFLEAFSRISGDI